jgi:hypothetical protein
VRTELVLKGIFVQLNSFKVEIGSEFPKYVISAELKNKCISPKISIGVGSCDI